MIQAGHTPIGLRQNLPGVAATGIVPKNTSTVYEPKLDTVTKIYNYADPENVSSTTLTAGGLFDFRYQTVVIKEVRGKTALTVTVCDRNASDDYTAPSHEYAPAVTGTTRVIPDAPLIILPSQVLRVSAPSNADAYIDVVFCKE